MSTILRPGQIVQAECAGVPCVVDSFLAAGGQGEVYRARLGSTSLALKWYFPESATETQRAALRTLVAKGSPSPQMLWPLDLTSARGVPGFGYLMPLRPPHFRSGVDLVRRRIEPTFRILATAALHLANGFLQLHASGLAYRDISFGNLFLDPASGDVLICDLDNVGIDGQPHSTVAGTMRFMAPEIVRGQAAPSTQTDQYSLAVLLHFLFFMSHPLEGLREAAIRCLDPAGQVRLYGTEPVYVADPNDKTNRPVRGRHDNFLAYWPIYPRFFKTLFTRAFTEGLGDPARRVKESEWRTALIQLRDGIFYCASCKAENFFDPQTQQAAAKDAACWACTRPLQLPLSLHLGNSVVMLNHDTRLYPHHLDDRGRHDFSRPAAEVTRHPTDPNVWGLKNLSGGEWVAVIAPGQTQPVPPGRNVMLAPGVRIQFGKSEGEVKYLSKGATGAS